MLIDTSVWIEALRPGGDAICRRLVGELVASGQAATCEVVIAELLRGARSDEEAEEWDDALRGIQVLDMEGVGDTAGRIGRAMRAQGKTPPLGDLLITAVALHHGVALLHRDRHIAEMAEAMGMKHLHLGETRSGDSTA